MLMTMMTTMMVTMATSRRYREFSFMCDRQRVQLVECNCYNEGTFNCFVSNRHLEIQIKMHRQISVEI